MPFDDYASRLDSGTPTFWTNGSVDDSPHPEDFSACCWAGVGATSAVGAIPIRRGARSRRSLDHRPRRAERACGDVAAQARGPGPGRARRLRSRWIGRSAATGCSAPPKTAKGSSASPGSRGRIDERARITHLVEIGASGRLRQYSERSERSESLRRHCGRGTRDDRLRRRPRPRRWAPSLQESTGRVDPIAARSA